MSEVHVFTSAAFNYIPKVRMLFQSLRKYHPSWKFHLALADKMHAKLDLDKEPFDSITTIEDLGIPSLIGWSFCHDIVELSTAIKPFMLKKLLELPESKKVIYLDPDIVVFSNMDEVISCLDCDEIVLTPHQIDAEKTLDAVMDNEICSLKHGVYNLGFVAVNKSSIGLSFAQWWMQRVYYFCRSDIPNGLFTDQKWIDLVPALFDKVKILRSPRFNVAPWNLTTRMLTRSSDGIYLVNDQPLCFYHFTGFDKGDHRIMAMKNSDCNPTVIDLVDWYENEILKIKNDPLASLPWAFRAYSDGRIISNKERLIYRVRSDLQKAFPDPYDVSGFKAWCDTQGVIEYKEFLGSNSKMNCSLTASLSIGFMPKEKLTYINYENSKTKLKNINFYWNMFKIKLNGITFKRRLK